MVEEVPSPDKRLLGYSFTTCFDTPVFLHFPFYLWHIVCYGCVCDAIRTKFDRLLTHTMHDDKLLSSKRLHFISIHLRSGEI